MQSIWSKVFQGGSVSVVTSITENYAHEKLSKGQPVYGESVVLICRCIFLPSDLL